MEKQPDSARLVALVAVVGIVAGALALFLWLGGDGGDDESAPRQERTTEPAETDGPPTPQKSPDGTIPHQAVERAEAAVKAYTQYGYTDAAYDSWMKRLGQMSTDTYKKLIRRRFDSPDARAEDLWKFETVPTKRETKTTIVDVALDESGLSDNTGEFLTFVVEYETSIRSTMTDGWTDPQESLAQRVTVVEVDGTWLVNNIEATDGPAPGQAA